MCEYEENMPQRLCLQLDKVSYITDVVFDAIVFWIALKLPSLSNITWFGQSVMIPQHEDHWRQQGQASSSIITTNCTSNRKDSCNVAKRTLRKQGSQGKCSNNTCQTKSELFPLAAKSTRSASQLRAKDLHNLRAERDAMRIALLLLPAMPSAPSSAPSAPTHHCRRRRRPKGYYAGILREAVAQGCFTRKIMRNVFCRDIAQGYLLKAITQQFPQWYTVMHKIL